MRCDEVSEALIFYLDGEVTPAECGLIQQHLAGCDACRQELAALAALRARASQGLQRLAAPASPSPQAWSRLEARLAREALPSPVWLSTRFAGLAQGLHRVLHPNTTGDMVMRKRMAWAVLAIVLAVAAVGVWALRSPEPVSAQGILNRAAAAQRAAAAGQGIQHTRTEVYVNGEALAAIKGASINSSTRIVDSYVDAQTGRYRSVTSDAATGQVVNASAFDGTYLYSAEPPADPAPGEPLTVYRSLVPEGALKIPELWPDKTPADDRSIFESMRQNPGTEFAGQETEPDGRRVYVLSSKASLIRRPTQGETAAAPIAVESRLSVDANTYQMVESRTTVQRDGQQVLAGYTRVLVQESLPRTAAVAWDLSDLTGGSTGVVVVDAAEGSGADQLPVTISQQELAARTTSAYMLRTPPAGYEMQIEAAARPSEAEKGVYAVVYRSQDGGLIRIQGGMAVPDAVLDQTSEVYKTASGLTLYFTREVADPAAKIKNVVAVKAPDGTTFDLASSLSHDQIKALAEQLVPVR